MAIHDAYAKGFCKAANDAGLDPNALVKIAKSPDYLSSIVDAYKDLDPQVRHALLASLISGLSTYAMSDGGQLTRLAKGLAGASLGGLGTYGLESSGILEKGKKLFS